MQSCQHGGPGEGDARVVRFKRLGCPQGVEGGLEVALGGAGKAEIIPGAGVFRVQLYGLFQGLACPWEVAGFVQGQGE